MARAEISGNMKEVYEILANSLYGKIKSRNVDFRGFYPCGFKHFTQENWGKHWHLADLEKEDQKG